MFVEIALGSLMMGTCVLIHVVAMAWTINPIRTFSRNERRFHFRLRFLLTLLISLAVVVAVHTVSVWLWAASFLAQGAFAELETAVYFALATYTTLGYGDIVIGEGLRIFAAMGAVNGLINFGLSTAFLIDVMGRFLPARHVHDEP